MAEATLRGGAGGFLMGLRGRPQLTRWRCHSAGSRREWPLGVLVFVLLSVALSVPALTINITKSANYTAGKDPCPRDTDADGDHDKCSITSYRQLWMETGLRSPAGRRLAGLGHSADAHFCPVAHFRIAGI